MAATILAVSEDEAFSTMLQEGLESAGSYQVVMAHSGEDARRAAASRRLDLMIVDADLEHTLPAQLVAEIRGFRPHLRLMWMLFLGQELPEHLASFEAHGLLTKPFFIEDLGRQVEAALGHPPVAAPFVPPSIAPGPVEGRTVSDRVDAPPADPAITVTPVGDSAVAAPLVGAATPTKAGTLPHPVRPATGPGGLPGGTGSATNRREPGGSGIVLGSDRPSGPPRTPAAAPPPPSRTPGKTGPLGTGLHALARSLNAEAALLLDLEGRVVAWSGLASRRMAPELAVAVAAEFAAAKRIAGILRGRDGDFVTHIHEGKDFWLFSMFLWESNLILSVAVRADVPLGTVRYQVRQAATELSRNARQ